MSNVSDNFHEHCKSCLKAFKTEFSLASFKTLMRRLVENGMSSAIIEWDSYLIDMLFITFIIHCVLMSNFLPQTWQVILGRITRTPCFDHWSPDHDVSCALELSESQPTTCCDAGRKFSWLAHGHLSIVWQRKRWRWGHDLLLARL